MKIAAASSLPLPVRIAHRLLAHRVCTACSSCHYACLGAGADKDAREEDQWTPLHWAAHNGHKECVQSLLGNRRADRQE